MHEQSLKKPERQRRAKRADVRAKILESAHVVFAEKGYEGASLESVAEAAGFSRGAVYSNFANKEELFFELVSACIDERAEVVRAAEAKNTARSRAVDGGSGKLPLAAANAKLAGKLLRELSEADPVWQTMSIEFWLRCTRNEELKNKLAEKRRLMRAKIADSAQAQALLLGLELSRSESMDLATLLLALSNGLGIEGLIDPEAVRPALFGEALASIIAPPATVRKGGHTRA